MTSPGELDGLAAHAADGADIALEGESSVQMRGWESVAMEDADRFAAELRTLGMPEHDVADGAQMLQSVAADASEAAKAFLDRQPPGQPTASDDLVAEADRIRASTRDNAFTRVRDWLANRRVVVDSREPVEVRVPLFVLAACSTPGCAAMFNKVAGQNQAPNWSITIWGAGLSGGVTITSSLLSSVTVQAGQACLLFLSVPAAVEQVHVIAKDGSTLGSGQRVDLSLAAQHRVGGLLFDSRALPTPGPSLQNYELSGYSGAPVEYEYQYAQHGVRMRQVDVKAAAAELSLQCEISMITSATLAYTLVGGRTYKLCELADTDGLVWR